MFANIKIRLVTRFRQSTDYSCLRYPILFDFCDVEHMIVNIKCVETPISFSFKGVYDVLSH